MSIKYVILGLLSEEPLTGYDLKKKFSSSDLLHWSGNNNQIYRTLVQLHQEQLVTIEVEQQESKPPRKIYTLSAAGHAVLREWLASPPELPQLRSPLLLQLLWADQLDAAALDQMLAAYADELQTHVLLLREQARRTLGLDQAHAASSLRTHVAQHWLALYEHELRWVRQLHSSRQTAQQP